MAGKSKAGKRDLAEQAARLDRELAAIRRALRKPLEAEVARGELTVPQSAVMEAVVRHNGISLKDLSREVSLAHSTVSGIVDRLESRGMLERRTDEVDGRVSRIHPTAIVTDWVRKQLPMLSRGPLETALERAAPAERDRIESAIRHLRELLERESPESER